MSNLLKSKRNKWILAIIIVVGAGWYYWSGRSQVKPEYTTAKAFVGELKQTITPTGAVEPLTEVDLRFKNTGKIEKKYVDVGAVVKAGDSLISQEKGDLDIQVRQALANLESAQADLRKLKDGSSAEDIKISEEKVQQSQTDYQNALVALEDKKRALTDTENEQWQKVVNYESNVLNRLDDDAGKVTVALAVINSTLTDEDAQSTLSSKSPSALSVAQNGYNTAKNLLTPAQEAIVEAKQEGPDEDINNAISKMETALNKTSQALLSTYQVLIWTIESSSLSTAELDTLKTDIVAQEVLINAAITNTASDKQTLFSGRLTEIAANNAAQSAVNSAQSAADSALALLNLNKAQLEKTKAVATKAEIDSQEAKVLQFQAALDLVRGNLNDSTLRAPVDGVVTKINFEESERAFTNETAVVMLGKGEFKIKVDVPEANIVRVLTGQEAKITLDAFGDEKMFKGVVSMIEPSQTIISDVVYYKATIILVPPTENIATGEASQADYKEIKSGMTANIEIMTNKKDGIIIIPQRAVIEKDGKKVVRVLVNDSVTEKEVATGLRGDEGMIEIVSGINEGDEVVTYVKNGK